MLNPVDWLVAWLSEFSLVWAMNRQNWRAATKHASRALLIKPNDADILGMRGVALLSLGKNELAIADFTRALELRPKADTYINRAIAYRDEGEFALSIADCDEALKLHPRDLSIYVEKAQTYRQSGDLANAIASYKTITENDTEPEYYLQLAETQVEAGDWDSALDTWQRALEFSPDDPDVLLSRGKAYEQRGETDKAKADFERAGVQP